MDTALSGSKQQQQQQQHQRAKKVRFYRNGDRHYAGYPMALAADRYRTFEALLDHLTDSPACDPKVLPQGVRFLFSLSGQRVRSLQDVADGAAYVCASFDQFKRLDYAASGGSGAGKSLSSSAGRGDNKDSMPRVRQELQPQSQSLLTSLKPKIVTIFPGGGAPRPRRAARVLLNSRTAKSFDRVMADISQAVSLPSGGAVRKLYGIDGKLVTRLDDLLDESSCSIFVAYGNERVASADFALDHNDYKFITPQAKQQQQQQQQHQTKTGTTVASAGKVQTASTTKMPTVSQLEQQQQQPQQQKVRSMRSSSPLPEDAGEAEAAGGDAEAAAEGATVSLNASADEADAGKSAVSPDGGRRRISRGSSSNSSGGVGELASDRLCDRMSDAALLSPATAAGGAAAAATVVVAGSSPAQQCERD